MSLIHVEHPDGCDRDPYPHVHLAKITAEGVVVKVLWDEPEPPEDPIARRVRALEANVQNIWEHLNARSASDG